MLSVPTLQPNLLQVWRSQVGCHWRERRAIGARPLAAMTWITINDQQRGLIDVRKLVWIVLYDDFDRHGNLVTRFTGHGVEPVPGGIRLGGANNCRFEKQLQLPPGKAAPGLRFDLDNPKILDLALQLDRTLDHHCQFTRFPRRHRPGLPTFWAAFESDAALPSDFQSRRLQANAANQTPETCRQHCGYHLRPLATARKQWRQIATVFADLSQGFRRQIIRLDSPAASLIGQFGPVEYDLFHSPFFMPRSTSSLDPCLAH